MLYRDLLEISNITKGARNPTTEFATQFPDLLALYQDHRATMDLSRILPDNPNTNYVKYMERKYKENPDWDPDSGERDYVADVLYSQMLRRQYPTPEWAIAPSGPMLEINMDHGIPFADVSVDEILANGLAHAAELGLSPDQIALTEQQIARRADPNARRRDNKRIAQRRRRRARARARLHAEDTSATAVAPTVPLED